jgi:diguanylate cyclase (GGDEF)-like protein
VGLRAWVAAATGFAALWFATHCCFAQQYSFTEVTQGLGNLNINCMAQDRTGYLWVGTENGLYRYDGIQFRKYGAADGMRGRIIESLFTGLDGTLFAGTTNGIYFQMRDGNFGEVQAPPPLSQFSQRRGSVFTAIAPDRVVAADKGGAFSLRRAAPDRWVAEPMHLEGAAIWSVQYGPGGELWFGCDSDLCRLADGKTTHMSAALHLPKDQWPHLQIAQDGHLWVRGFAHVGEVIPAENRFVGHDLPGRSNGAPYEALTEDAKGRIAASEGAAFGLWDKGRWRMISARNGLSNYDISTLFLDREGSLWIGVVGHGLRRWVGQDRWEAYTAGDGLSDNTVWSTLRDRSGRFWIGTESGLDFIPSGDETPKTWQAEGIETARAVSLAESADGGIWMGSAAGSLVRIDPRTLAGRQWKVPEVYRVLSDGAHRVWVATDGGLYVVDTAARDGSPQLVEDPVIAHPWKPFTDVCVDSSNRVWAASEGGFFLLDGNGWHRIDPGHSGILPSKIVADGQGNLWAAGSFPGIMRLRVAGDQIVESEQIARPHLMSEQIVSLAVDHRGWLWVGQDAGLTVYDGHTWRSSTQEDGLVWNDLDENALAEDRDGSMWIGTSGGLSHLIQPQDIPAGTPLAPVISQVTFGGKAIGDGSTVKWSDNPLAISMAALSFRDAHHIRTRYRLLGLETEWVETADRRVRYPRLEPGAYRFQAAAVDDVSGAISPIEVISFRVSPQWWQYGPLRLGLILLVGLAVVVTWLWRIRVLVGQKRQLELAVMQRTEDLEREKAELLRARDQMRHYAEHDDMTGLWNHRIIIKRLQQEVDRAQRDGTPVSVILIDLDHFKQVNDTYGHPAGDLVLKEIGVILQRSVRSYDWVGRYGGEEFLLILPSSTFVNATTRAEQIRTEVQMAHIFEDDKAIKVTASLGVASGFPSDYASLIQAADTALYRAKNNGRNQVVGTEMNPNERHAAVRK